jgi:hypothetical protein
MSLRVDNWLLISNLMLPVPSRKRAFYLNLWSKPATQLVNGLVSGKSNQNKFRERQAQILATIHHLQF